MTVSTHTYTARVLSAAGTPSLAIKGGTLNMDDGQAPRVVATLVMRIPSQTVQDALDPRKQVRVEVVCRADYQRLNPGTQTRTFNLGLRDRVVDRERMEMTLSLASDEALLMDDVLLGATSNNAAEAYQSSLRAIIDNVVLSRIGAHLEPGTADAPFLALTSATNLVPNPGLEVDVSNWVVGGNSAIARTTAQAARGAASLQVGNVAVGSFAVAIGPNASVGTLPMTAGQPAVFEAKFKANAPINCYIGLRFFNASNAVVGADVLSPQQAVNSSGWTLIRLSTTVPATAVKALPILWGVGTSMGHLVWIDDAFVSTVNGYFDGDTTDTPDYGYDWTGAANVSTSTRTALAPRSPEFLRWQPGVSGWEFIQPLFRAGALRLFCDEARRWFLVDASYFAPGQTQLAAGLNVIAAEDVIARSSDEWFDAGQVIYRWNDSSNVPRTAYDFASSPGYTHVHVLEVEQAFPGAGAAAYMVKRAAGKGRQITVRAVSLYAAQPAQSLVITIPETPIQTGAIASVEFSIDTDEMRVVSRALTDTPTTSWVYGPPGKPWTAVPVGMSWNSFNWAGVP